MLYCSAAMGSSSKISRENLLISSTGMASEEGLPAVKGMISGSEAIFRISRMAEGFRDTILSENV